jgi:pilus assembly protein Flp/PilA
MIKTAGASASRQEPAADAGGEMKTCPSRLLRKLIDDDSGQDLIEYALIAALIAVAAIAALRGLDNKISSEFNTIGSSL